MAIWRNAIKLFQENRAPEERGLFAAWQASATEIVSFVRMILRVQPVAMGKCVPKIPGARVVIANKACAAMRNVSALVDRAIGKGP